MSVQKLKAIDNDPSDTFDDSDDSDMMSIKHIKIKTGQKITTYWSDDKTGLVDKSTEYKGVVKKIVRTIPADIFTDPKKVTLKEIQFGISDKKIANKLMFNIYYPEDKTNFSVPMKYLKLV